MYFLMGKNLVAFFIFILVGMLHMPILFADRDDEANKLYLDAYNLYKLGKIDQSLEILKKVVKINPEYVEAYQRLWLAYKKLGMNDRAEEELLKYKKLIEERMQTMGGDSSQVAKPVSPPPQREERVAETKPAETKVEPYRPPETRPPEKTVPETKVAETRPSEVETGLGKSIVVKPVAPPMKEEYRPPVVAPAPPPVVARPVEPPKPPQEMKSATKLEEYKSPYIKVDKKDPAYK